MAKHPPLHVVAPMLDEPEHTAALLDCLGRQTLHPTTVRLLDNGSTDATLRAVKKATAAHLVVIVEAGPGLTIYELWNRGFWHAQQSAAGGGFHCLIVNTDVVLPPWALEQMSEALLDDDLRGASYPDFAAPWSDAPVPPPRVGPLPVETTRGVWGSGGMLGFCFLLAGHRISWRPLVQDLAYEWWFGDNAIAESIELAGLSQVKVKGLPIRHAHEGTAHAYDLAKQKERDYALWAARRRFPLRINQGARQVQRGSVRRDWRRAPGAGPRPGGGGADA